MKEHIGSAIACIQKCYDSRNGLAGLSTGIVDFDRHTGGLRDSQIIVIGARPSMGKTALATNMVEHIGVTLKKAVAFFSPETDAQVLVQRMLCSRARVDNGCVRLGFLRERDFPALQSATAELAEAKIFIDDTIGISMRKLRKKARRLKIQQDIQAIFVDDFHLIRSRSNHAKTSRRRCAEDVFTGLKALSRELNIPVVVLAELSRKPERRSGQDAGRPDRGDLRGSRLLEDAADLVCLLWREEYYTDDAEKKKVLAGHASLTISKNRNCDAGNIDLTFLKRFQRFEARAQREASAL